jgi:hypothetical protein
VLCLYIYTLVLDVCAEAVVMTVFVRIRTATNAKKPLAASSILLLISEISENNWIGATQALFG